MNELEKYFPNLSQEQIERFNKLNEGWVDNTTQTLTFTNKKIYTTAQILVSRSTGSASVIGLFQEHSAHISLAMRSLCTRKRAAMHDVREHASSIATTGGHFPNLPCDRLAVTLVATPSHPNPQQ